MSNTSTINQNQVVDVAIIGGGVSGAYTAWRLAKSKKDLKVCLYELSDRIGGRLLSVPVPDMPNIYAEFGGMAFSQSQAIVYELAKKLGLKIVEFSNGEENDLLYLRNQHLRLKDIKDPSKLPYNLSINERGMTTNELFNYVVKNVIPNSGDLSVNFFTSSTWKQLRESLKVDGQYLYNISIWELILKIISNEAYEFCLNGGYYYSSISEWNAAQAIEVNMSFSYSGQPWLTIANGYQELPKTLVAEFEQYGGEVYYKHRLTTFKRHECSELIELNFIDENKNSHSPVLAKHLVLAMPKRSLELLCQHNQNNFLFNNSQFIKNIQTVSADPVYKLFLGYEYPWWRTVGVRTGASNTDLPMRQCFYFGTEGEQHGSDPTNLNSLMMAIFSDSRAVSFWKPMEYDPSEPKKRPAFQTRSIAPLKTSFLKADGSLYIEPLVASKHMVQTVQDQLKALHGMQYIPEPYVALYLDWTKDPYGGGWHVWNPYCKPWEVMKQMRHPVPGTNVYICGDCYSNFQGWVQGALNSAELMLEENFHLERPDWLPDNYDLGT
ncbi:MULTISPECIES: flavin monoamine oxidase family protein [Aerosakkonema]|uniref:flavin monoamine oxidase family protein n=1 Tax=Aerosakkonema TaxID=1246629 RepID=UPI0035BAB05C